METLDVRKKVITNFHVWKIASQNITKTKKREEF